MSRRRTGCSGCQERQRQETAQRESQQQITQWGIDQRLQRIEEAQTDPWVLALLFGSVLALLALVIFAVRDLREQLEQDDEGDGATG